MAKPHVTPYLPQTLRRLDIFKNLGSLGIERAVVGDAQIAVVMNEGRHVAVFGHGVEHAASSSGDRRRSAAAGSSAGSLPHDFLAASANDWGDDRLSSSGTPSSGTPSGARPRRGTQQDVLLVTEGSARICDCLFHKNSPQSPLNLVVVWVNGAVKMWDYRCGKWSPAASMKLSTAGTIVSGCISKTDDSRGSLVYVERRTHDVCIRSAPLTQGTVRLSSTLIDSTTAKATTGELLASLPLQENPTVLPAPRGCAWVICPQSQILLLPVPSNFLNFKARPAPSFSLNARSSDALPGPAPPGPCVRYTSFVPNYYTCELLLFDDATSHLTIVGACVSGSGAAVHPRIVERQLPPPARPDAQRKLCYLNPTFVGLLASDALTVVDVVRERVGDTALPADIHASASSTWGYTGPPLLVGTSGVYKVLPEAVIAASSAPGGAGVAADDDVDGGGVDWDAELTPESLKACAAAGGGAAVGRAQVAASAAAADATPRAAAAAGHVDAVYAWAEAESPLDALEATEVLGEHLNVIAKALGKPELGEKRYVQKPPKPVVPKGKRKVRLIIPPLGADDACEDEDDDVSWSTRLRMYDRHVVDERVWEAVLSAEGSTEDLASFLVEKPPAEAPKCVSTEGDLFAHLVSAGAAGEEEYWDPPPAPTASSVAQDKASVLLDDLGLYCVTEADTQAALLRYALPSVLAAGPDAADAAAAAIDAICVDVAEEARAALVPAAGEEEEGEEEGADGAVRVGVVGGVEATLPCGLGHALPFVFEALPHVVPLIALVVASLSRRPAAAPDAASDGDEESGASAAAAAAAEAAAASSGGAAPRAMARRLRALSKLFLPHLVPCSCPTQSVAQQRSRTRVVALLTLWSGDPVSAALDALRGRDARFVLQLLREGACGGDAAAAAPAGAGATASSVARAALECVIRRPELLGTMEYAGAAVSLSGSNNSSALSAAAAVAAAAGAAGSGAGAEEEVCGEPSLDELLPVTQADVKALRSELWARVAAFEGGDHHLLALLNTATYGAAGGGAEGFDGVGGGDDRFGALRDVLKDFAFGKACPEDINAAAGETLARLEGIGGPAYAEDLLQIVSESPFCWDSERMCFTPHLDASRAHLLYNLLLTPATDRDDEDGGVVGAGAVGGGGAVAAVASALSVSDDAPSGGGGTTQSQSAELATHECPSTVSAPSATILPGEADCHPLAIPLCEFLPLLGAEGIAV